MYSTLFIPKNNAHEMVNARGSLSTKANTYHSLAADEKTLIYTRVYGEYRGLHTICFYATSKWDY